MNKMLLPLVFCFAFSMAQGQSRNTPYDFPVKPGTEEWKKLTTGKLKADACSIPEKIMVSLTTKALAQTCLNYPLLHEVFYADNLQQGIAAIIQNFNGITELFSRKDGAAELMALYAKQSPLSLDESQPDEKKGAFTFGFTYLELLLARPEVVNAANGEQRLALLKMAVKKYDEKLEKLSVFGGFGLSTTALLMASILNVENLLTAVSAKSSADEIELFLKTATTGNMATITLIYETARNL